MTKIWPFLVFLSVHYTLDSNDNKIEQKFDSLIEIGEISQAIQIANELSDTSVLIDLHLNTVSVLFKDKKFKHCIKLAERGVSYITDSTKNAYHLTNFYENISSSYFALGNYKKAYEYKHKYVKWYEVSVRNDISKDYTDLENKFLKEQTIKELEYLKKQNRLTSDLNNSFLIVIIILSVSFFIVLYILFLNRKQKVQLKELNLEKTYLVQEVQHRVKNNLQNLISLLSLQTKYLDHPSAIESNLNTKRRIQAISLTNEMLLTGNKSEWINTKDYLSQLIENIRAQIFTENTTISYIIDDINLKYSRSLAIGFILSELISNTIKHNQEIKYLEIRVQVLKIDQYLYLKYEDSGSQMEKQSAQSLGTKLVEIYTKQLKAELTSDKFFNYKMKIPLS